MRGAVVAPGVILTFEKYPSPSGTMFFAGCERRGAVAGFGTTVAVRRHGLKVRIGVAITALLLTGSALSAQSRQLAVIVHPRVSVTNLPLTELRRIFMGERQTWTSNLKVNLVVPKTGSAEREMMLKQIYSKNELQFRQHWIAMVGRKEALAGPKEAPIQELAVRFVRQTPGAIALVDASEIPNGVRLLTIDGKKPGEAGYALKQ